MTSPRSVIGRILPPSAVWEEAFDDSAASELFPEEEAVTRGAAPQRVSEFRTVRRCSRQALEKLGVPPAAILPGPRREPRWPSGIVGSLTHCEGYRAAAVARCHDFAALGIDAEPHLPLPAGLLPKVARPEELVRLAQLTARYPTVHWDRLTFSAKESVYKAWSPLAQSWLGFHDAALIIHPLRRTFHARLYAAGCVLDGRPLMAMTGRWTVEGSLIGTSVAVDAPVTALPHGAATTAAPPHSAICRS
ncbi:4'-phosphopantetheinyl transferase family protein [Streptomyces apocyni]|uniref:4'-phosphopantetheinyl transferase family protein n=1 Tax=Streptomyces apocyni TaxID=2654677 RepID=UPI001E512A49|nr:4'-phosphopantetheinyl transferase superfamily protein [Streptomyces apocyni]